MLVVGAWAAAQASACAVKVKDDTVSGSIIRLPDIREIDHVAVFHIPDNVSTMTAVTPEELQTNYFYEKLEFRVLLARAKLARLRHALSLLKVDTRSSYCDARWGILFYGKDKKVNFSLFTNQFGTLVTVNGENFETGKYQNAGRSFIKWLKQNFSSFDL